MTILDELKKSALIFIACPNCDEEFSADTASLFDATARLPEAARQKLSALRDDLKQERIQHSLFVEKAKSRTNIAARVVNIGKTAEKIAPSLTGFPEAPADCRAIYEPIDYIVFRGLQSGLVDSLAFVDVKSGRARLSTRQREVRALVEAGRVTFHVTSHADTTGASR